MDRDDPIRPVGPVDPSRDNRPLRDWKRVVYRRRLPRRRFRPHQVKFRQPPAASPPVPVDTFVHGPEPDPMEIAVAAYEAAAEHIRHLHQDPSQT